MFLTFLLFQMNLDMFLVRGKGPKNSVHSDLDVRCLTLKTMKNLQLLSVILILYLYIIPLMN